MQTLWLVLVILGADKLGDPARSAPKLADPAPRVAALPDITIPLVGIRRHVDKARPAETGAAETACFSGCTCLRPGDCGLPECDCRAASAELVERIVALHPREPAKGGDPTSAVWAKPASPSAVPPPAPSFSAAPVGSPAKATATTPKPTLPPAAVNVEALIRTASQPDGSPRIWIQLTNEPGVMAYGRIRNGYAVDILERRPNPNYAHPVTLAAPTGRAAGQWVRSCGNGGCTVQWVPSNNTTDATSAPVGNAESWWNTPRRFPMFGNGLGTTPYDGTPRLNFVNPPYSGSPATMQCGPGGCYRR